KSERPWLLGYFFRQWGTAMPPHDVQIVGPAASLVCSRLCDEGDFTIEHFGMGFHPRHKVVQDPVAPPPYGRSRDPELLRLLPQWPRPAKHRTVQVKLPTQADSPVEPETCL